MQRKVPVFFTKDAILLYLVFHYLEPFSMAAACERSNCQTSIRGLSLQRACRSSRWIDSQSPTPSMCSSNLV